ncbi:MAG: hypothetical protein Q8S33_02300 [Myxococcales bacterium]|nr:hypothetical protein [Myxococcales bacterium]
MDAGAQIPRGTVSTRSAEFRNVPQARQDSVNRNVQDQLLEKLDAYSPHVRRELAPLVRDVGTPHFYKSMARFDRDNRAQWVEMAKVQKGFADAEPGYNSKTRAYSESMRLTLHSTAVLHRATSSGEQYSGFIQNHVTAFRENGGWFSNLKLDGRGAAGVMRNTPAQMARELPQLARGLGEEDPHTQAAAEMVRRARDLYADDDGVGR